MEIRGERRRTSDRTEKKMTDLGSDVGERDEHVERQRCKHDDLHHFYEHQQKPYVFHIQLLSLQETTRLEASI